MGRRRRVPIGRRRRRASMMPRCSALVRRCCRALMMPCRHVRMARCCYLARLCHWCKCLFRSCSPYYASVFSMPFLGGRYQNIFTVSWTRRRALLNWLAFRSHGVSRLRDAVYNFAAISACCRRLSLWGGAYGCISGRRVACFAVVRAAARFYPHAPDARCCKPGQPRVFSAIYR